MTLTPKVKVIGKKAGICDGVPSTAALVLSIFEWPFYKGFTVSLYPSCIPCQPFLF